MDTSTSSAKSTWSTVITTTVDPLSRSTSVQVFGYETTVSDDDENFGYTSVSTVTTSTSLFPVIYPLLTPPPLDPECTRALSAYDENLAFVTRDPTQFYAAFQVGFNPTCLPNDWSWVNYYSPGICPSGYSIAYTSFPLTIAKLETVAQCCYMSYTWDYELGCTSYLNPNLVALGGDFSSPTTGTGRFSTWTVVAEYTTTSIFHFTLESGSTGEPTSTGFQTTSIQTITSDGAALVIAPGIQIRWGPTDQAVLDWLALSVEADREIPEHHGLSGGAIAGIVIGAIAGLAVLIGALLLWLRIRKRRAGAADPHHEDRSEEPKELTNRPPDAVYVESGAPKSAMHTRTHPHEQYAGQGNAPLPNGQDFSPHSQPTFATGAARGQSNPVNRIHNSPQPSSAGGSTLPPTDQTRNLSEWNEQTAQPDSDASGFLISHADPVGGARSNASQLERLKEEKARLQRLQEISEMEARLEQQLERDFAGERR